MRHVDSVQLNSAYPGKKAFMQVVASDDDDEEIDMAGTELLDNLTFITSKGVMGGVEGKPDWVTGIQGESLAGEELRAKETEEHQGRARIEFHRGNVAETIEEEESGAREERDLEPSMVTTRDWDKQIIKLTSYIMTLVIAANIEQSFN